VLELNVTQLFPATYLWNSGSSESSIIVAQPGTYDVSIIASCGEANLSTQILTSDTCDEHHTFFIPNVFSPNGDGINDVFSISAHEAIEIQNLDISIFDRWGNLIFLSHEKAFAWDGRFKNEDLMPAVFVYLLEVDYVEESHPHHRVFSGDVTLIR
jgi:gliding motility-associated-like protein